MIACSTIHNWKLSIFIIVVRGITGIKPEALIAYSSELIVSHACHYYIYTSVFSEDGCLAKTHFLAKQILDRIKKIFLKNYRHFAHHAGYRRSVVNPGTKLQRPPVEVTQFWRQRSGFAARFRFF